MRSGFAKDAAEEYEMPDEAYRPVGKVNAAATEKGHRHNQDYAAHLAEMSEPYELLDGDAMREVSGLQLLSFRPLYAGYGHAAAGALQPGHPRPACTAAMSRSSSPHRRSGSARDGAGWMVQTPDGRVSAAKLVLTVNGHIESFGYFARRLMHIYLFASMTRALSGEEVARLGGEPNWGFTPSDPLGTTVRRISGQGGDRIVVRNGFALGTRPLGPAGKVRSRLRPSRQDIPIPVSRLQGY